ncbi:protein TASOR isoform X2 [Pungitius pungitius]|uniref:protein TASOR isoform X2 n=1 Tax=Pungitius pungitius TaxID=134920 RepID=UPI002E10466C
MDDGPARWESSRPPRRLSAAAAAAAAEVGGASVSLQDEDDLFEVHTPGDAPVGPDRLSSAAGTRKRSNSATQLVYERYMPMGPLKFPIPRKPKEKRALFQFISTESREYDDMMTILTSSYIDTGSAGCFTYSKPRLVHSELLEKEFVEKRKEMKADGRTDKELEQSYCFLLADSVTLPVLCEKGLLMGQSRVTVLGNPIKGVYLSRYSDLIQITPLTPGVTGDIVIFKVMKGKVKSIYENMKNLLDPTPRFDSHTAKNASKVTSLASYRAFDLTQQYFYEYSFDELRPRPRQVCPYAVVSFQFKGKDSSLPSKPLAPIRLNSQSADGSKERTQFTVWTGDLVKGDRLLFQVSLRSFSPPLLPHRLLEKLEIGLLMRLDQATKLLPADLFCYDLYSSGHEVVKSGYCCSLLEMTDRSRSVSSVTSLLRELEMKKVVLMIPLSDRGVLLLLSSVQMATPSERAESWKRCLQALFVFRESRHLAKPTLRCASSTHDATEPATSGVAVMPRLSQLIPALHHALVKARANPPPELSAGVERQARDYLTGLKQGTVQQYPMGEYDSALDECRQLFPTPKHHQVNMDGYLRSYLYSPALYQLSVARAKQMVEAHCGPEETPEATLRKASGGRAEERTCNARNKQTKHEKMQQLVNLVLTCKKNAENEVKREEGAGAMVPGRKRKLEQVTAERALKFLKASQEPGRLCKIPGEGSQAPYSTTSLPSVIGLLGLKDLDLREDRSEAAVKLLSLLTDLNQAAGGTTNRSVGEVREEAQRESSPLDRLATKLGLPTNCDIDLRKQQELEEQAAGSVSSLEGFSPSSHSGEMNHHGGAAREGGGGGGLEQRAGAYEKEEEHIQWEIPWVLIPITGVCSQRYTHRDRNIPQDPRFQHLATATSIAATTKPRRQSPTRSPERSSPPSPLKFPSPEPSPPHSPYQCPSPDPSPPLSPSQCPSPEPSPPPSPSQCPSPEPSPPPSPRPNHIPSPSRCLALPLGRPTFLPRGQSAEPIELVPFNEAHSGANVQQLAPTASGGFAGLPKGVEERPWGKEKSDEPFVPVSIQPSFPPAPERRPSPSPPPTEREKGNSGRETVGLREVQADIVVQEKETLLVQTLRTRVGEEEEVEMTPVVASGKEQKAEEKEPVGGALFSPSFLPPSRLDSVVDKQLSDFYSEIQLLLQQHSVHYSFPPPHSTSNTETSALPHTLQRTFSQYVTFYNPCPPVQDYVCSLQDGINGMLTEFENTSPAHKAGTSGTDVDSALASSVSQFVSSIRAGKDKTGGEPTAAESPATSRGGVPWQPHTVTKQVPDAANTNPPVSHVTLSVTTSKSGSGSGSKPTSASVRSPPRNESSQSALKPQQGHALEISVAHGRQDPSSARCLPAAEVGSEVTFKGLCGISKPLAEPPHTPDRISGLASEFLHLPAENPVPPAASLSSLISRLQPEVFNNLLKIFKDVKRNSAQFYLHSGEAGDRVHDEVKEYLLKQGKTEQSPVDFLNQENSANRLLVIIKNKDIAGQLHKIPGLLSLKRHASVVFVGINDLDDIRNNCCEELLVSGGCIVSDEFVLNPDFITRDQLASLLVVLEQHSSPHSVWRWKVHWQTHKKLKEQARFRRDAADLLEVLSAYQKRQIVELLPYHNCDKTNHQSPDLECLMEIQAQHTQYRHTVFLTFRGIEMYSGHSRSGIIVASINEILHNFTGLVGYHDIKDRQPIIDDMLGPKGLGRHLTRSASVSGSERSPSVFSEHIRPFPSYDQPHLPLQCGSTPPAFPHWSDQLVPDASFKEVLPQHSDTDFEVLRLAISQLRAERKAQLQQQLDARAESYINSFTNLLPNVGGGSGHSTPLLAQGGPTESEKVTQDKNAVAVTLDMIHSALHQEQIEDMGTKGGALTHAVGRRCGGSEGDAGHPSDGSPVRVGRNGDPGYGETTPSLSNQSTATRPSIQTGSTSDGREKNPPGVPVLPTAAQYAAASYSTTACPVEGPRTNALRETQLGQEQPIGEEGAPPPPPPPGNSTASGTKIQNPRPLHQLNSQPTPSPRQQLPNSQQQRRGAGLLQTPYPPRFPNRGPLAPLGGGLLGPMPRWPGGLGLGLGPGPTSATALVWGLQQASGDMRGPPLLGSYYNPAGQGVRRYRGGASGGGFNGM